MVGLLCAVALVACLERTYSVPCSTAICGAVDGAADQSMDLTPMCVDSTTCSADAPVCVSGICAGCIAGVDGGSASECATYHAATPLCGPAGACVECLTKDDCASAHQTCDVSAHSCAPCKTHSDCSSGACDPSGACVDAAMIAYVDKGDVSCDSNGHPHCEINEAIASAGKPYIVVRGLTSPSAYYQALNLDASSADINVTIVGPGNLATPPAQIAQDDVPAVVATASGKSLTLTLDGFVLFGSGGAHTPTHGLVCMQTSGTAIVTIRHSSIKSSGLSGVSGSDCTIALDSCTISGNSGTGVSASSGSLSLDSCTISGNSGGGVSVTDAQYDITNSFIVDNLSMSPGVAFNGASDPLPNGGFRHNTLSGNGASGKVGGIKCSANDPSLVDFSIIWMNTTMASSQFSGTCVFSYLVTDDGILPSGAGNNANAPQFAGNGDYHLAKVSANSTCCIDKIPSSPVDHDIDGDPRPLPINGLWDIGADEVQ